MNRFFCIEYVLIFCRLIWLGGFILGGTNGIFMAAPPLVSVLWFPVQERTTATSIGTAASFIGGSLNFLAGR